MGVSLNSFVSAVFRFCCPRLATTSKLASACPGACVVDSVGLEKRDLSIKACHRKSAIKRCRVLIDWRAVTRAEVFPRATFSSACAQSAVLYLKLKCFTTVWTSIHSVTDCFVSIRTKNISVINQMASTLWWCFTCNHLAFLCLRRKSLCDHICWSDVTAYSSPITNQKPPRQRLIRNSY